MHRRCASNLVRGAWGIMILRRWHRITTDTSAVFVFRAGHTRTTPERKNCGDLQATRPHERDTIPTGAIGWSGISRKTRSFRSADGTGICLPLSRPCLIAVSDRQPLRSFLCTSSRAASGGIGKGTSTRAALSLFGGVAASGSASQFVVANRASERESIRVLKVNIAPTIACVSLKSPTVATRS